MHSAFQIRHSAAFWAALGMATLLPAFLCAAPPDTVARKIQVSFGMELQESKLGQVLVVGITPGSQAATKGIRQDDVILGVNKVTVVSLREVAAILDKVKPGATADFQLSRDGKEVLVGLTVPLTPPAKESAPLPDKRASAWGMVLLEDGSGRALVSKVSLNSPAANAGIREGDFLIAIGGEDAASYGDLLSRAIDIVDHEPAGTEVPLGIMRGKETQTVNLVLPETVRSPRRNAPPPERVRMVVRTAVARLYPAAAPQSLGQQQPQPAGLVMFRRDPEAVEVYSELSGLAPGAKYQLVIHQYGDIADDPAKGAGGIYSPEQTGPAPQQLLVVPGNLGMVEGGQDGRAVLKREVEGLLLNGPNSIVGRVVALHEVSPQTPEALGPIVAYGVIGVGNPLR